MPEEINVLSLFDGISGARLALERAGIKVNKYFASEIDKYAIKISEKHYPDTIKLGDVTSIKGSDLPQIDLIIGGSPCQAFSVAGKQLAFNDPRGKLLYEYVRLLKEVKPKYFLLENVKMKKECRDIISNLFGVQPIEINSALVSAQNRRRLYWTNIPGVKQPEDKNILIEDIVNDGVVDIDKSYCIDVSYYKGGNLKSYFEKNRRQLVFLPVDKHSSILGLICTGGIRSPTCKLWLDNGKTLQRNFSQGNRVYSSKGKAPTLNANTGGIGSKTGLYEIESSIRKLHPIECERLQTLPDNYTEGVSNTQRYKAIGNGFTIDVISHILRSIPCQKK